MDPKLGEPVFSSCKMFLKSGQISYRYGLTGEGLTQAGDLAGLVAHQGSCKLHLSAHFNFFFFFGGGGGGVSVIMHNIEDGN